MALRQPDAHRGACSRLADLFSISPRATQNSLPRVALPPYLRAEARPLANLPARLPRLAANRFGRSNRRVTAKCPIPESCHRLRKRVFGTKQTQSPVFYDDLAKPCLLNSERHTCFPRIPNCDTDLKIL